jgi:cytochrome c5
MGQFNKVIFINRVTFLSKVALLSKVAFSKILAGGVVLFSVAAMSPVFAETPADVPYTVECPQSGTCKVDKGTFKGWRSYHAFCHVCHAQDAVGSSFAPSLLERLKGMDKKRFDDVVTNGFTGQVGVMPAWKDNPNVMPRIDDLWSYLRARSDGVLKPGRPKK